MLSSAMGGSVRLSQPDIRNLMYSPADFHDDPSLSHSDISKLFVPGSKDDPRHALMSLCKAPFQNINEEEMRDELPCRAPIASLDCMEEFQGCGDHVSSKSESHAFVSRQTSAVTTALKYKPLGKSGLRVSQLGLGAWITFSPGVPEETADGVVTAAYDAGINFFDLSEAYSSGRAEVQFGNLLKRKNWRRNSYHVMTKVYWNAKGDERGLSRKHIVESVKGSLERLQLEYVDVVIIHRADDMCPMEEVVRAMSFCIDQGWVMYWGTARWSPVEIMEAWTNCRQFNCPTPIVEQSEYHMFCRGKTELYLPEMFNKIGVGTMAWSPLTLGLISEKMDNGVPVFTRQSFKHGYTWLKDKSSSGDDARRHQSRLRELGSLAERLGCTISQLSVAWTLKNENLHCALVGGASVNQLLENIAALQVVPKLTSEVLGELERILDNKPVRPVRVSTLAAR
ncbi:voltage-gated potassium channel subunit beta-2 isoform X2 [Hyalella azteca]|uniref:Voltage-gated potassium channel subunit beta-2 isoform X2 n=1 Tax=Hyalella azteca TaxID=294128 RepID=A0A8B7NGF8_HYAAZ|nr:voltage-gated potassium channel subunit beta-2 isoform X2 [Hyalella azteca]